jgi:hypothetical protein
MTFLFPTSSRAKVIESAIERRRRQQEEAEKQIRDEVLQKPILYLAKNRDYDEILFVLINDSINVRDWIDVAKAAKECISNVGTNNVSRRNSCSTPSSNKPTASAVATRRLSASLGNLNFTDNADASESSCILHSTANRKQQQHIPQESVLHIILKFDPPVEIIDLLIQRMNEYNCFADHSTYDDDEIHLTPEVIVDTKGRTPLHIAVSIGSSYDVVLRLVGRGTHHDLSSCPAFLKDSMSRYPLHWACTNPSTVEVSKRCLNLGTKAKSKTTDNYNLLKIVQLLLQINPESVVEKDINGQSPIDIAKKYLVKDEILRLLEKVEKWVSENGKTKKTKEERRRDRNRNSAKQSKFDSSLGTSTSRTSTTTDTTLPSRESSTPQLKYNENRVEVSMKLIDCVEQKKNVNKYVPVALPKEQTNTSTTAKTATANNDKKPTIPKEIFQNVEIVPDYYGTEYTKEYVEVDDDVSSVGSGGISTFAQPQQRKQRVLTHI